MVRGRGGRRSRRILQAAAPVQGQKSGELTLFHCDGRAHVYALCCALVADKLVCLHRTEANRHRSAFQTKGCDCFGARSGNDGLQRWIVCENRCVRLGDRFPGSWLLAGGSQFDSCRRTNARDASGRGVDSHWSSRRLESAKEMRSRVKCGSAFGATNALPLLA